MGLKASHAGRRSFLQKLAGLGGVAAAPTVVHAQADRAAAAPGILPEYVRAQNYKSLKQSSFDKTGGNADRWPMQPGQTLDVFQAKGPGMISHIWFTISAQSANHLKEIVIRPGPDDRGSHSDQREYSGSSARYWSNWAGWGFSRSAMSASNVQMQVDTGSSGEIGDTVALGKVSIRANVSVTFELK